MTLEQIANVDVIDTWGSITYKVTLTDSNIVWVPNDPQNSDWPVVQEWLALHP